MGVKFCRAVVRRDANACRPKGVTVRLPSEPALTVLRRRSEFLAAAASGKKWVTPAFVLQVGAAPESDNPPLRYGLTASKKIGNAVKRNRARRRLRVIATKLLPPSAKPGYHYILIAREKALTHDFQALERDFLWALKRLDVRRENHAATNG